MIFLKKTLSMYDCTLQHVATVKSKISEERLAEMFNTRQMQQCYCQSCNQLSRSMDTKKHVRVSVRLPFSAVNKITHQWKPSCDTLVTLMTELLTNLTNVRWKKGLISIRRWVVWFSTTIKSHWVKTLNPHIAGNMNVWMRKNSTTLHNNTL